MEASGPEFFEVTFPDDTSAITFLYELAFSVVSTTELEWRKDPPYVHAPPGMEAWVLEPERRIFLSSGIVDAARANGIALPDLRTALRAPDREGAVQYFG